MSSNISWLVVWLTFFLFPINIGILIIPIDELIFFRRVQTTNQYRTCFPKTDKTSRICESTLVSPPHAATVQKGCYAAAVSKDSFRYLNKQAGPWIFLNSVDASELQIFGSHTFMYTIYIYIISELQCFKASEETHLGLHSRCLRSLFSMCFDSCHYMPYYIILNHTKRTNIYQCIGEFTQVFLLECWSIRVKGIASSDSQLPHSALSAHRSEISAPKQCKQDFVMRLDLEHIDRLWFFFEVCTLFCFSVFCSSV